MATEIARENISDLDPAKQAEVDGDLVSAARLYEDVIKADTLNEFAYNRLMIIYRKQQEPRKELGTIDKGVKAFQRFFASRSKHSKNSKIAQLSQELLKKTGLIDKKGIPAFEPEPIAKWKKRRLLVEKKLEASLKKKATRAKK